MRIAFLCPDDLSTAIFCKGFTRTIKKDNVSDVFTISPVHWNYAQEIKKLGGTHISVDMDRFINLFGDIKYIKDLYRIFKEKKIEVLVNFTTKPNIYGSIAAKLAGVPTVFCAVRGLGRAFLSEPGLKSRILKIVVKAQYRLASRLSDVVWFTNPNDLDYFVSDGVVPKEKVLLTKNAIDTRFFSMSAVNEDKIRELKKEFGINSNNKVIVMVARLIWSKGIREFVEASEILSEKHPNIMFLLIAPYEKGSYLSIPESYIKEKQKSANFIWQGFRQDIREIYALSDVSVLPSYYKEGGYPRALLEPMALGKPVITTDIPDCKAPVEEGKNGYLVPAKDSRALASAIEALVTDEDLMKEFGKYSRAKVEKEYDENIVISKILDEVKRLLQEKSNK